MQMVSLPSRGSVDHVEMAILSPIRGSKKATEDLKNLIA